MPRQQSSAHKDNKHAYIESDEEKNRSSFFIVKLQFCFQVPISDSAPCKEAEKNKNSNFFLLRFFAIYDFMTGIVLCRMK